MVDDQPAAAALKPKSFGQIIRDWLKKLPAVLVGAAFALAVGVYDNLKGGVVSNVADWVRYNWSSPVYILALTDPIIVDTEKLELTPVGGDGKPAKLLNVALPPSPEGSPTKFIQITAYPGRYWVRLRRATGTGPQVLATQVVRLNKPEDPASVDTSDSQWSTLAALTTIPKEGGSVRDTRWTLAPSDSEALASTDGRSATILKAALGQLGVWEQGNEADKSAIDAYWKIAVAAGDTPSVARSDTIYGLWGGAFLAWAVAQGGGKPPRAPAAFRSWKDWGTAIPPSSAKPGMVAVLESTRKPPTPSGLLVGIFVRQRPDCTEIVTGNIADRVVVTCAPGRIVSFRSAE